MFQNQHETCSTSPSSQVESGAVPSSELLEAPAASVSSTCECKQLRLRVAHLQADLLHLQERKAHLEEENEAFAAADQVTKAKLAEAIAENRHLEALLAEKSSEERRKCTVLEAQQADIASSISELQSIFDQFTKMLAENELGAKLWRSAKSKHIAASVRRQMDKHGFLDSSSALWDRAVRLRLGSDLGAKAHKRHSTRQPESHPSHVPRDERESPRARREARRSPSLPLSESSSAQQSASLNVASGGRGIIAHVNTDDETAIPSCGKHQELIEVYDALEREAKRDDWLVDRSFKQDLADARRYLRQGNVEKFPCVGEILADWSSALDKIKDNTSGEQNDIVRRELDQLRQALGQAQKARSSPLPPSG